MSYVVILNILFQFCNDDVCMKKVIIRLRAFDFEKLPAASGLGNQTIFNPPYLIRKLIFFIWK